MVLVRKEFQSKNTKESVPCSPQISVNLVASEIELDAAPVPSVQSVVSLPSLTSIVNMKCPTCR